MSTPARAPLSKLTTEQRRIYDQVVIDPGVTIGTLAARLYSGDVHPLYIHLPKIQKLGRVQQRGRDWWPT